MKTMTILFNDGRPPLYSIPLSETNKRQYEKIMGNVIAEFIADKEYTLPVIESKVEVKKEAEEKPKELEISQVSLIKHLNKQGKTLLSISKFLSIPLKDIENIINN